MRHPANAGINNLEGIHRGLNLAAKIAAALTRAGLKKKTKLTGIE
jgi:hypothetical protein